MITIFLRATPWAVPVTVAAALLLLPVLRRSVVAYLFWLSVAGFLSVTTTPNPYSGRSRTFSWTPSVPDLHQLLSVVDQTGLNALIAVPMGLLGAVLALRRRRWYPVALVVALPPLAEGVQWLVPALGRVSFYVSDVTANWTGVALGLVFGGAIGVVIRLLSRAGAGAEPGA